MKVLLLTEVKLKIWKQKRSDFKTTQVQVLFRYFSSKLATGDIKKNLDDAKNGRKNIKTYVFSNKFFVT